MSKYVKDIDMGYRGIKKSISDMKNKRVVVGVLEGTMHKDSQTSKMASLAPIAAANEFGVPSQHIPARSFIRYAMDQNKDVIKNRIATLYWKVLAGDYSTEHALGIIGEFAQQLVQKRITEIRTPPNAPRTIAQKGSSKPLVDSGQLRASIRWKIEDI